MSDTRPIDCRFRQQDEGRAYPRSACNACGKTITTGLGRACTVNAATEIEALRRENQELRAERDEWKAMATEFKGLTEEWQARAEQLEAALEPFAKEADLYDPPEGDDDQPAWSRDFPIGMLRRARSALTMSDIHREQLDRPDRKETP